MNKQQSYQQRHLAAGLCEKCPEKLFGARFCKKHLLKAREKARVRAGCKPWQDGKRGRRPMETNKEA